MDDTYLCSRVLYTFRIFILSYGYIIIIILRFVDGFFSSDFVSSAVIPHERHVYRPVVTSCGRPMTTTTTTALVNSEQDAARNPGTRPFGRTKRTYVQTHVFIVTRRRCLIECDGKWSVIYPCWIDANFVTHVGPRFIRNRTNSIFSILSSPLTSRDFRFFNRYRIRRFSRTAVAIARVNCSEVVRDVSDNLTRTSYSDISNKNWYLYTLLLVEL